MLRLTTDERKALTDVIVDEVAGAVPVLVGAGAPSVAASIDLARYAEWAGASGVVLPAPAGGVAGEAALVDYFARIASSVSIPVMIQDAFAYLGVRLGPRVVHRASALAPNVCHVKLEAGPAEMGDWMAELGSEFSLWGGDGGIYLLDCIRTGAAGVIPGVDLVDQLVRVYEAESDGRPAYADELFREVLPMLVFEIQHSIDHFNACAKRVLVRRGVLTEPGLRMPAAELGEVSELLLSQHLAALETAVGETSVG